MLQENLPSPSMLIGMSPYMTLSFIEPFSKAHTFGTYLEHDQVQRRLYNDLLILRIPPYMEQTPPLPFCVVPRLSVRGDSLKYMSVVVLP